MPEPYAQGRYAEAEELTRLAEDLSAADDLTSQALWRSVRAKALAQRGLGRQAEACAREAVDLLRDTDTLVLQADALEDLAEVLALGGTDDGRDHLEEAPACSRARTTSSRPSACERRCGRSIRRRLVHPPVVRGDESRVEAVAPRSRTFRGRAARLRKASRSCTGH